MTRFLLPALLLWGLVWVVGAGKREVSRPLWRRGSTVVGAAAMLAAVGALWRYRRHVIDGAAVVTVLGFVAAVGFVWLIRPAERPLIVFTAVVVALFGLAVWDWEKTGGRPWRQVISERKRADEIRRAVAESNPDARPGRVTISPTGAVVEVEHLGQLDPERVGQALHAPHAEARPGAEMGRATIHVHDEKPSAGWDRFAVAHRWPGPSSTSRMAPIPIGLDGNCDPVCVPFPGDGGRHLLLAGATGAGKSVLLSVILAELVHRDVDLWLADPKWVELAAWEPVAAHLALGDDAVADLLEDAERLMMDRFREMRERGIRQWDGRHVVVVMDEIVGLLVGPAAVVGPRKRSLNKLLSMCRAAGMGFVLCTQRPSTKIIEGDLRDNLRVRIGLGMESDDGTEMVMGSSRLAREFPCHDIPESLPGVGYVRLDRSAVLMRSFLLTDTDVAAVVAQQTRKVS